MDPQERYEVKRRIEQSGVCAVYEGFDKQLQRKVAIKRLLSDDESGKDYDDLMRECQSLSALASAHIVSLHDVGRDEDGPFMVLELLEGDSLQKIIDEGPIELEDFYQIAEQTLEGLMAAHDIHLIHRDLKPSNINVHRRAGGRLQVKLQDFGLAKFSLEPSIRTIAHSNTLFGSIYYMAPEQFERQPLDNRTDIYSLGAVYYHMLAGQYPYDGDSGAQVMIAAMNGGATDLAELRPDLDPALCDWIMSMIAKEPDHRPASCADALENLAEVKKGVSRSTAPAASATPAPAPTPAPTPVPTPAAEPAPVQQMAGAAAAAASAAIPEPEPTSLVSPTPSPAAPAAVAATPTPVSPNPVPAGPGAAPAAADNPTPTVKLAGAAAAAQPGMNVAAMQGVPTQQMGMPGPSPTVQMIGGGQATRPLMPTTGVPAPRITGPISAPATTGQIGGGAMINSGARPPLPRGSSFAPKQSSPFWWLWLVGAAAAAATVLLVLQAKPPTDDEVVDTNIENMGVVEETSGTPVNSGAQREQQYLAEALNFPAESAPDLMHLMDESGDEQLDHAEFCVVPATIPVGTAEYDEMRVNLNNAFEELDRNKDGYLRLSELLRAYSPLFF